MTRDEFLNLYAKLTSKLSDSELEQLHNLLCKFEIEKEDLRILDAFYMPNGDTKVPAIEELTPSQMKYELRNIFVLLRNNYSGYDFFNKNNELDRLKLNLEEKINKINTNIKTKEFIEMLSK